MTVMESWKSQLASRVKHSALWHRWLGLPAKDRLALLALGGFMTVVLFYALIWQPASRKLDAARSQYQLQRELFTYVQTNSVQAHQLRKITRVSLAPEQLQGLVTSSAQQHGLVLERYDSEGNNGLQVTLAQAAFEPTMRWLSELEQKGVSLIEVSLDRAEAGKVDVRLSMSVGSEKR